MNVFLRFLLFSVSYYSKCVKIDVFLDIRMKIAKLKLSVWLVDLNLGCTKERKEKSEEK